MEEAFYQGIGARQSGVRFVRGIARNRRWREVECRPLDWASRSLQKGVRITNHGRSTDRRDVWVGLKPIERLRTSRGRRSRGQRRTKKTTHRSERRSVLKKDLTGPTLLEMSGFPTTRN